MVRLCLGTGMFQLPMRWWGILFGAVLLAVFNDAAKLYPVPSPLTQTGGAFTIMLMVWVCEGGLKGLVVKVIEIKGVEITVKVPWVKTVASVALWGVIGGAIGWFVPEQYLVLGLVALLITLGRASVRWLMKHSNVRMPM